MVHFKYIYAIVAFGCSTMLALPAAAQSNAIADEHAVFGLEDQFLTSRMTGDGATVEKAFADDGVFIHENGDERTKPAYQAGMANEPRWTALSTTERVIHLYDNAAVTHAILYIEAGTDPAVKRLRMTAVYARQAGAWRIVSWQATPLADARYAVKP
jgi:hypothetical protein